MADDRKAAATATTRSRRDELRNQFRIQSRKRRRLAKAAVDDDNDNDSLQTTTVTAHVAAHAAAATAVSSARTALTAAVATVAAMRAAMAVPPPTSKKDEPTFVRFFVFTNDTYGFAGCNEESEDDGKVRDNLRIHWIRASREDLQWMCTDSWLSRRRYPHVDCDWKSHQLTGSQVDLVMKYATDAGGSAYNGEPPSRCVKHIKHDFPISIPDAVKAEAGEEEDDRVAALIFGDFSRFRVAE